VTPFHDLQDYLALPRLTGLRLSPDGDWLAVTVSALAPDGRTFKSSIWRVDTGFAGPVRAPARLTWSAEGEDSPAFLPDGGMLFLSARPAPPVQGPKPAADAGDDTGGKRALWLLPAAGGEARRVTAPPGGLSRLATAASGGLAAFTAPVLPGTGGAAADGQQRQARAGAGVTAILHESAPVR
jgi:dipeptidyl aminopeptidase/acylaminoacyl peptidase